MKSLVVKSLLFVSLFFAFGITIDAAATSCSLDGKQRKCKFSTTNDSDFRYSVSKITTSSTGKTMYFNGWAILEGADSYGTGSNRYTYDLKILKKSGSKWVDITSKVTRSSSNVKFDGTCYHLIQYSNIPLSFKNSCNSYRNKTSMISKVHGYNKKVSEANNVYQNIGFKLGININSLKNALATKQCSTNKKDCNKPVNEKHEVKFQLVLKSKNTRNANNKTATFYRDIVLRKSSEYTVMSSAVNNTLKKQGITLTLSDVGSKYRVKTLKGLVRKEGKLKSASGSYCASTNTILCKGGQPVYVPYDKRYSASKFTYKYYDASTDKSNGNVKFTYLRIKGKISSGYKDTTSSKFQIMFPSSSNSSKGWIPESWTLPGSQDVASMGVSISKTCSCTDPGTPPEEPKKKTLKCDPGKETKPTDCDDPNSKYYYDNLPGDVNGVKNDSLETIGKATDETYTNAAECQDKFDEEGADGCALYCKKVVTIKDMFKRTDIIGTLNEGKIIQAGRYFFIRNNKIANITITKTCYSPEGNCPITNIDETNKDDIELTINYHNGSKNRDLNVDTKKVSGTKTKSGVYDIYTNSYDAYVNQQFWSIIPGGEIVEEETTNAIKGDRTDIFPVTLNAKTGKEYDIHLLEDEDNKFDYTCSYKVGENITDKGRFFYRIVDLSNMFPNKRNAGPNWSTNSAKLLIDSIAASKNTLYTDNKWKEYSATITSANMNEIKAYNVDKEKDNGKGYLDGSLVCEKEDGTKCKSKFLDLLETDKKYANSFVRGGSNK